MVDADDPRPPDHQRPDPERPDRERSETSHGDTGHGESVDGSELGEELDVFTGDPVDALFDVEMSGESPDDTDTDATAHGLGEVAEFSVDARSGEELPPELMPAPTPSSSRPGDPFELELLDPTDPGITREDLEGFDDEPPGDLPPVDIPVGEEPTVPPIAVPVAGPVGGDTASPPPDDPYAALAAIVGEEDEDDDWEIATEAAPPVEERPAADPQPAVDGRPAGPFDDVPSASAETDDDKYAWLYDEDVEPPPAVVERYRADDPLPADAASPTSPSPPVFPEPEPEPEPDPEPEPEPEPDLWTTPGEPDDETRIFDLTPADAASGAPLADDAGPEEVRDEAPAPGDLVPGDLAYDPPAPDPDVAGPDLDIPDGAVPDPGEEGSFLADAALGAAALAEDAPIENAGAVLGGAGTDDPFALAGSIFDDVDPGPGEADEPDWESFTGEHILSSTQEYVGLAEELTRSEPPSEQIAISAGIPGMETSLVGLDDVVGSPPDEVVAETRPDLGLRILSGFGLLALFAVSLLWSPAAAAFAVVVLLAAAGEFYAVLVANGRHPVAAFGLAGVAGCLIGTWVWGLAAVPVSLTVTLVAVALFVATAAPRPSALDDTALTMLVVAWIGGLGAFALPIITDADYRWLIAGVVAVVAALDIGQYFVGRRFGSRPLAPVLSPKKTVEGLIGGAISALLVGVLLSFLGPFDRMSALLLAVVAVALGPLGDLSVSMVKRILAVKDMGTVLPGHGGILDRIDALLFVIPAAWVVLRATGLLT